MRPRRRSLRRNRVPHRSPRSTKQTVLRSILGQSIEDDVRSIELTITQFFTMAMFYQMNIYHLVQLIEILKHVHGVVAFISVLLLQLLVGIPILTLITSMSNYSKKGFLKFWDCLPIFKGIGFSILFARFLFVIYYVFFGSITLVCMMDIIVTPSLFKSISTCEYDNENVCLPMYPKTALNLNCSSAIETRNKSEFVLISTQYYMAYRITERDSFTQDDIAGNAKVIVAVFFIWCTVFSMAILGVNRIKRTTLAIQQALNWLTLFIILFSICGYSENHKPYETHYPNKPDLRYWIFILLHSSDPFVISDMIWVGMMKPKQLSAQKAGFMVGVLKTFIFLSVIFYSKRCVQFIIGHYQFADSRCLIIYGHDTILSFVPDVLHRYYFGVIYVFVWYTVLFWTNLNLSIFTVISIINALMEQFRRLGNYRLFLYIAYCLLSFSINIYFCMSFSFSVLFNFHYYYTPFLTITCLFFIIIGLLYIYSIRKIVEDYLFLHGNLPNFFFIITWRTTGLVVVCTSMYMLYQLKYYVFGEFPNYGLMILNLFQSLVFVIPFFLIFGFKCYSFMKPKEKQSVIRRINKATTPSANWGPSEGDKEIRKLFCPWRTMKYHNTELKNCPHYCMANSENFLDEEVRQRQNLEVLQQKIEMQRETEKGNEILREIKEVTKGKHVSIPEISK